MFQRELARKVEEIRELPDLVIEADKSSNYYLVSTDEYRRMVHSEVTQLYKKSGPNRLPDIDKEASVLTRKLEVDDRVDVFSRQEPFLSIKDHKPSFPARVTSRLINPSKSQICKISKILLDRINGQIRTKLGLKHWTSTKNVIDWFNQIPNKHELCFIKFDIISFYPDISPALCAEAISFARRLTNISDDDEAIMMNARKQILSWEGDVWEKKSSCFDVAMGSFDGAEMSELVGLLALFKIKQKLPDESIGLYI